MSNRIDVQKKIGEITDSPYDIVRKKYLAALSKRTGRNTILYYSGWLQNPATSIDRLISITDDDKNGFMTALQGLDTSKGLDLILHTPGGSLAATESLIDYLNQKFNGNMRGIVPQLAMSGGTIIAFACKEIWMGKQSSLGPIDPQINGVPASGIVSEFYSASEEMRKDKNLINVWGPIISGYKPALIENCKKAISWSKELAFDYLEGSMFKSEIRSNPKSAKRKINQIIGCFTDPKVIKTHARHIPTPVCKSWGLKIVDIEQDQSMQDIILSIHHASALTTANTHTVKIIENHRGQKYLTKYSK